ncbi:MAG: hexapeptide transferase [Clostridia bacterium]|nr:hexapeptide transferase [Clostridia bacterium]
MSSKLRPLYDKLYTTIDVKLVALQANRDGKKRAKKIPMKEGFDRDFRKKVVPYWKKFGVRPKKHWFRIYCEKRESVDPRFIPDDIWFSRVVPHYNHILFSQALQDKCLHQWFVPDVRRPETVVKNISGLFYDDMLNLIDEEEAIRRCMACERYIVKPSVGSGRGADIHFYNGSSLSEQETKQMFAKYKNKNFIVQKPVRQHKVLSDIYDKSLNTIRVVTFVHKGEAHVLSVIVRMGAGGSEIDNFSKGGYACKVHMDGNLDTYAVDRKANWVTKHPGGAVFAEIKLPRFDHFIEVVKTAAKKVPHFSILGWDFAIDEDGEPVFIEYNVIPDQNQKTWGPTFGDMTDEILEEVFKK